ncbi:hypothetical protein A2773_01275 [Candidatus Gottesmanbacteria bacterium RIFCSPHIGHO2_01_FULL_39_10]|uniref:GHMP kinase N-terminal domain-containing protein n=1 Tax=Candidatus Gottesmanbacteria bacterium RIFCSPHIGHO2_01_FULL_39_10 TaxID=1798375 RepID=A0A1F5ZS03_9BACT|nr:MAG: hypothetical protein A2773_01275 [Candidatus Gottesmanbacteria bacterium RIFCSPHIGHO2_01_FULL_39_10]
MIITVSAPAKVHLMGEHSVVYGKPALVASLEKRLFVTIEDGEKLELISGQDTDYLNHIIDLFSKSFKKNVNKVKITVISQIPVGRHIGSSSALAVAATGALMRYFLKVWDPKRINEIAYQAEKKIHTNPSGADNTVCCFGGLVWYRKETEFLKSIWNLPVSSYKIPQFILIDTGKPKEGTGEMVKLVAKQFKQKPEYMEQIFNNQEKQTKRILISLKTGNLDDLKDAMLAGERNLEKMGVVSISSQKIIKEIEKTGGAAKICGGGGKKGPTGFLLAYHASQEKILNLAQKLDLTAFPIKLGEEGVKVVNG